jgi:hypothetical protein
MLENPLHALHAALVDAAAAEEFQIDEKALRDLDAGLTEALLYRDVLLVDSADRDRISAHRVLQAVNRFLLAHPRWRPASLLLGLLDLALTDLERGHAALMLCPRTVLGRPASYHAATLRGYAAGIMDGLMKHAGMSKRQAAEWISKKLSAAGYGVATGTVID